ncbi:MAG: L-alanine-DL-glutamate epimerase [Planctomycetaceae bacterium]
MAPITIKKYRFDFVREPLVRPFRIKGSSFNEKWTLVTALESSRGTRATGLGGTAVLWSDPSVFHSFSEAGGNGIMALMAEKAAQMSLGREFQTPIEVIESIFPGLHEYGTQLTGNSRLTKTFTLNTLVSLDLALWLLYGVENGYQDFDSLIPSPYRNAFPNRADRIAHIPTVSYDYPLEDLLPLVNGGHFILKIKLGQPGSPEEMLAKDGRRLSEIHGALAGRRTPISRNGKLVYYLDANARYPDKTTLGRLVEIADREGMLDQIALVEEPFPEEVKEDVSDLPVRVAADESLHDESSVAERVDLGYRALAMKPAGKTLSMSFKMAAAAYRRKIPCFVADNACIPVLVEWNKNFAARLDPFPGLSMNILESNGGQNYRDWDRMIADHPCAGAGWIRPEGGVYRLDDDFYRSSGGIFRAPGQYQRLVEPR